MTMDDGTRRSDLTAEEQEVVGKPGDLVSEAAVPRRPRVPSVMVSVRIDRRTFDDLSQLATEHGETFSTTAREALRAFVHGRTTDRWYPEPRGSSGSRRVSDNSSLTWGYDELHDALARYEAACRRAEMRDNARRSYVDYARRFLAWREGEYWPRGTTVGDRPVPRGVVSTAELRDQAKQYAHQVQTAGRVEPTVDTYFRHAMFFIRWLDGDFTPGARLHGLR